MTPPRYDRSAGPGWPAWVANNVRRVVDAQSPDSALPRHASAWTPLDASGSRSSSNCHQPHDASGKPASDSRPCGETNSRLRSTTQSAPRCTHSRPPRSGVLNAVGSRALVPGKFIVPGMILPHQFNWPRDEVRANRRSRADRSTSATSNVASLLFGRTRDPLSLLTSEYQPLKDKHT